MKRRTPAVLPAGYERARVGNAEIVALATALPHVQEAVRERSLYDYAAAHQTHHRLHGRAPVYVTPLPHGGPTVVVRHARHGGLLAKVTGDRFPGRTRAARELALSARLASLGVPTPTIVAYAIYPAGPMLARSDVATLLIEPSSDLATILAGATGLIVRDEAVSAAAALLVSMARTGVRHPDLNLKNILLALTASGTVRAYLLDIDRVTVERARAAAAAANAARLMRSARKWRRNHAAPITTAEMDVLEAAALGRPA
jgi:3-deoxy-D-manno-octulosonic acid kinase